MQEKIRAKYTLGSYIFLYVMETPYQFYIKIVNKERKVLSVIPVDSDSIDKMLFDFLGREVKLKLPTKEKESL